MNEYRYKLDKSSKKFICPDCTKKRFVKYIDAETGEYLPEQYGRCDRESNCGYYFDPYKNGYSKMIWEQEQGKDVNFEIIRPVYKAKPQPKKETVFIPLSELKKTLKDYDKNIFIQNLLKNVPFPFEVKDVEKIISLYRLGTVTDTGAVCYPFIDVKQNVRAIQEKIFNTTNHTDKSKKYHTSWLHSRLQYTEYENKPLPIWLQNYLNNDTKVSCLFGEHLLKKYANANVFLFEAPKTAVYFTLYFGFPEQSNTICLAVFNLSSLNLNKCKVLKDRNVYLFPDLSKDKKAFDLWSNKATEIQKHLQGTYFHVSDLLEQLAPQQDKEQGKDIADYLIKQDWRLFRKQDIKETPQPELEPVETSTREKREKREAPKKTFFSQPEPLPKVEVFQTEPIREQPENWSNDITELENYFASIELPTQPVKLNGCSTIKDCSLFIESHFATVKANNGKRTFLPYLNRLQELKQVLTTNFN